MPRLVVLSEGLTGRSKELLSGITIIGRTEDNSFQIPDSSVSTHHCEAFLKGEDVVIRDLNSTNGTFINGQQITETVLRPSQILRLGQVEIRLEGDVPYSLSPHAEALTEALVSPSVPGLERRWIVPQRSHTVEAICRDLAGALDQNQLVFCSVTTGHELQSGFAKGNAAITQIVGSAFNHLVVLDARQGCDAKGSFNLDRFYGHTFQRLRKTFALGEMEAHHEQDIIQILRDESELLLCLLHLEVVPLEIAKRLRSLTQEGHRTLVILEGAQPKLRKTLEHTQERPQGVKFEELVQVAKPGNSGFEKRSTTGTKVFIIVVIIVGFVIMTMLVWVLS